MKLAFHFMADILGPCQRLPRGYNRKMDDGEEVLGVNNLVAGFVDETGTFEAPLDGFSFEQAGVRLVVNTVQAVGLDNFTEFDILRPIAPQTMQKHIPVTVHQGYAGCRHRDCGICCASQ